MRISSCPTTRCSSVRAWLVRDPPAPKRSVVSRRRAVRLLKAAQRRDVVITWPDRELDHLRKTGEGYKARAGDATRDDVYIEAEKIWDNSAEKRRASIADGRAAVKAEIEHLRQALERLDEHSITYIAFTEEAPSVAMFDAVLEIAGELGVGAVQVSLAWLRRRAARAAAWRDFATASPVTQQVLITAISLASPASA